MSRVAYINININIAFCPKQVGVGSHVLHVAVKISVVQIFLSKIIRDSTLYLYCHKKTQIPKGCSSAFDVICQQMEQRMAYGHNEQVRLNTILPPVICLMCCM
jgi:hypothetical protein